jgi:cytidylate kinase
MSAPGSTRHRPKSIEELIAAQVRRWEAEREKRRERPPDAEPVMPPIALSREFGAGGLAVARVVAERLGFRVWNREIVHEIAERSGVRESLLSSLDEQTRRGIKGFVASLVGQDEARLEYARQLGEVVRTIAEHGAAVIVGRGANLIVDPTESLRVRILLPRDRRVADYAKRHGVAEQEAARTVDRTESERAAFLQEHFGASIGERDLYDLIINRSFLDIPATAAVVVAAYEAKFGHRFGGENRDDD